MSAYALADQLHRMRIAIKKPLVQSVEPLVQSAAATATPPESPVEDVGVIYGVGPRAVRNDPYGAGDVYPVFQAEDPRNKAKQFLTAIQRNRAIGRLPRDMYQSMWHFLTNHHQHWKRETQMDMWRNVAAFYRLVKASNQYPGWTMTYDFEERLSKNIAPFQETVVFVFRDLSVQLGVPVDEVETAALLDPIGPIQSSNGDADSVDIGLSCNMERIAIATDVSPAQFASSTEMTKTVASLNSKRTNSQKPLSRTEIHLRRWFRESHPKSLSHISHCPDTTLHASGDAHDRKCVVHCEKTGSSAHVTELTHKRMREIGMVFSDGSLPKGPDPMQFFWIQAKPDAYKETFGRWDPIDASWTMHTDRTVVPIERRYAPLDCGYGTNPNDDPTGGVVDSHDYFRDYEDVGIYDGTGLEPGLEYLQQQAEQMGEGVMLGTEQGWGKSGVGDCLYFTPQLRHVEIDHSVTSKNVANKQYVYGWFGTSNPVQPAPCKGFRAEHPDHPNLVHPLGHWDSTNACWVFPLEDGKLAPVGVITSDTERERDVDMREEFDEESCCY